MEIPFGFAPEPLSVRSGRDLWVRGVIDRVDTKGGGILVRDIKTGKSKPRWQVDMAPNPDLQLGLYALVAPRLASIRDGTVAQVAYVYPAGVERERSYGGADLDGLLTATRDWLDLAAALLEARAFPHATETAPCNYCPYRPLCGDDADAVSRRKLRRQTGALARFLALTQAPDEATESPDA